MKYYSVKTRDIKIVNSVLNGDQYVTITNLNSYKDEIKEGDFILLVFGGDKPSWDTGFKAVCRINGRPKNFINNSFELDVEILLTFPKPLKKSFFISYIDAFDTSSIGPSTKGERNQAITQITTKNATAILRTLLDDGLISEENISVIFGIDMYKLVTQPSKKLVEIIDNKYDENKNIINFINEINSICNNDNIDELNLYKVMLKYADIIQNLDNFISEINKLNISFECKKTISNFYNILDYIIVKEDLQVDGNNNKIIPNTYEKYKTWLISEENPKFEKDKPTPTPQFKTYFTALKKIVDYMFEIKLIHSNCLDVINSKFYEDIWSVYLQNKEILREFDNSNSNFAGRASLQLYITYIKQLEGKSIKSNLSSIEVNHIKRVTSGKNLVVYGTPGCGKSWYVENVLFERDKIHDFVRTTFFQDYSNTDFVGQIIPVITEEHVSYEFKPGPFSLALELAIKNPEQGIALVIEELNRGNASSIFGDIFQLLDRDEYGESRYCITNTNVQSYLMKHNSNFKDNFIKLPSNLSIYATMNTSDQNVFTLDTAFKRRWEFEKIKNNFNSDHEYKNYYIPGMNVTWEKFATTINEFIIGSEGFINSDDKQIGVYFIDKNGLRKNEVDASTIEQRKKFAFKVLSYLWEDVAKYSRDEWFNDIKSLDTLIDKFVENNDENNNGHLIFNNEKIKFND